MSANDELSGRLQRMQAATVRPMIGDILRDQVGGFGSVLATLKIECPADARVLRRALKAEGSERATIWITELDAIVKRAGNQRWRGWESVHEPE